MNAQATPEIRADRKTTRVTQGKRTLSEINAEIAALNEVITTTKDYDVLNRANKAQERLMAKRDKLTGKAEGKGNADPEAEIPDTRIAPPQATADMFPGLVGDVASAGADDTGISKVAVAANFLSFLGAMAGRDMYYSVGNTRHHPRLFTLHIGRSSIAGKGDALGLVRLIANEITLLYPGLLGLIHDGGLSSKEGLAMLIHDGFMIGTKEKVEGTKDKRLWVVEEEISNTLQQCRREGNTLSEGVRALWDGRSIKPANKNSKVWTTRPHVGITGGITPRELHSLVQARDLFNGFANRFFIYWAERAWKEPFPEPSPVHVATKLAMRTAEVIRFALGNYPKQFDTRPMPMSARSKEFYRHAFHNLDRQVDSDLLISLLERRAPHMIRLAMLFAQCDLSPVIEESHLQAAQAWIDYNTDSVRYVFAAQANETRALEREQMAREVVHFLSERPQGATLTAIIRECFHAKTTPQPLGDVLDMMLADHRYALEMQKLPRVDGKHGRPRLVYRLTATCGATSELSYNPATARVGDDSGTAQLGELSPFSENLEAKTKLVAPKFATYLNNETRVVVDEKLSALVAPQIQGNHEVKITDYAMNSGNDAPETITPKPTKGEL